MPLEATRPRPRPLGPVLRARGITGKALAEHVNVSEVWISQIINGRARPSDRLRAAIAGALELDERDLF